ncbi:MAG: DUF6364 family protein [Saprospiraceae bacterium]
MTTKLTLSMDKDVIEKSKKYAESQHRSLSDLIESYLKSLTSDQKSIINSSKKLKSLRGSFKAPVDYDYKKVLEQEISRKHE